VTICVIDVLGLRDSSQMRHYYQSLPEKAQMGKPVTLYAVQPDKYVFSRLVMLVF